jgi:hypothetical protein
VIEGEAEFLLGDRSVAGGARVTSRTSRAAPCTASTTRGRRARLILTFSPAGIEKFFEETLDRAEGSHEAPPDNLEEVAARYVEAAPRYGIEFYT